MKKIICIGECSLDIVFDGPQPVGSMPGGRIVNAAAVMGRDRLPVQFVSELAKDPVGDMIAAFLDKAGVDTSSVDRFTEGRTPVMIYGDDGNGCTKPVRYEDYPDECFDVIWPRIDEGDIVVYGGYYALDHRMRPRMSQLLSYAGERNAVLVYLPGFLPQQEPRITRVMPTILENLECASVVIARDNDLSTIFGNDSADRCFRDRVSFYCPSLINVDAGKGTISYYSASGESTVETAGDDCRSLLWNAGAVAGVVEALYSEADALSATADAGGEFRCRLLSVAAARAEKTISTIAAGWQKKH